MSLRGLGNVSKSAGGLLPATSALTTNSLNSIAFHELLVWAPLFGMSKTSHMRKHEVRKKYDIVAQVGFGLGLFGASLSASLRWALPVAGTFSARSKA